MKKKYLTIALLLIVTHLKAETMSGGGYTLNGGLDTYSQQSSGGGYILNPQGNPISGDGSSGGGYTLQPTPYTSPAAASQGQVMGSSATGATTYGQVYSTTTTTTATGTDITTGTVSTSTNPDGDDINNTQQGSVRRSRSQDYNPNDGLFGHGQSSTYAAIEHVAQTPTGKSILWILLISLLIIFWRLRRNYKKY